MKLYELLRCCAPDTFIYIDKRYHGLASLCTLEELWDLPVVQFYVDGNALEVTCGQTVCNTYAARSSGDLRRPAL